MSFVISWISDWRKRVMAVSSQNIERYWMAISNVCCLKSSPSWTLVSAWRSAMNTAASFPTSIFFIGRIAPMRFPRWSDSPVGLMPVISFFIKLREMDNILSYITEKSIFDRKIVCWLLNIFHIQIPNSGLLSDYYLSYTAEKEILFQNEKGIFLDKKWVKYISTYVIRFFLSYPRW